MTDQRARALWKSITDEMLLAKRSDMNQRDLAVFTDHRAVTLLRTALADAERRGMLKAANGLDAHVVYGPSDEAYDNEVGKDGDGTSYNQGVRAAIAWIRAQATQEEAND